MAAVLHPFIFRADLLFGKDIISQKKFALSTNNTPQYLEEQGLDIGLWKCG
jgi:hypothetical protein